MAGHKILVAILKLAAPPMLTGFMPFIASNRWQPLCLICPSVMLPIFHDYRAFSFSASDLFYPVLTSVQDLRTNGSGSGREE
ncbi:hypothetical protein PIB30_003664 [Stylosanthes scabra]|uniref:Uncharacterized protein n=1 Tax=Stylosanthes scabra TaxID=79078 RepID=A0ABU6Z471_9FABA|nr:hypothetical protein [Stylosanthes scabra]